MQALIELASMSNLFSQASKKCESVIRMQKEWMAAADGDGEEGTNTMYGNFRDVSDGGEVVSGANGAGRRCPAPSLHTDCPVLRSAVQAGPPNC
jgi:hypothetical protein